MSLGSALPSDHAPARRGLWRNFGPYLAGRRAALGGLGALTLLSVSFRLLEPWPLKLIIDGVFLDRAPAWITAALPGGAMLLGALVLVMLLVTTFGALTRFAQRRVMADVGLGLAQDLRGAIFASALQLAQRFHNRRRSGDMVMRMMADIRILRQAFVQTPIRLSEDALMIVAMTIILLLIDWQLTLVAAGVAPIALVFLNMFHAPMRETIRKQRKRQAEIASSASEALSAMRVVQSFGREKAEIKRFGKAAKKDMSSGLQGARLEGQMKWAIELTVALAMAIIIAVATLRIRAGAMTPGDLIIFAAYLTAFYKPFRSLARTLKRYNRAASAAERVVEILHATERIEQRPGARPAPALSGDIRFEGVGVSDRRKILLGGIDLTIPGGSRIVLMGETGAGKTTLASLIPRLIDPVAGAVRIGGLDVRDMTLESLRAQVMLVTQEPMLFAGTVAENIAYPGTAANLDLAHVAEVADAMGLGPLIDGLPEGWQSRIADRGHGLSGGQQQAISLLRGVMANRPILILDEPTTGLDPEAAQSVMAALRTLEGDTTVILITHDLRLLMRGDRVIVMADGRITMDVDTTDIPEGTVK